MGNRNESELLFEQVTISETSIAGGADIVRCRLIENSPGLLPPLSPPLLLPLVVPSLHLAALA